MASPILDALRTPRFRRLFLAQTISRWGDTFNFVALVILVFRLTGSGLGVAGTVAFEIVPVVAFGFVAGAVVDRTSRRNVMIAADLGRAAIAAALALHHDSLWIVYAAAFGLASFAAFFNPAAASVVPALVRDEHLVGANSALWSAAVISQIVLAPVAGAVVAVAGPGTAFALNAASFVVSAALLARLDDGAVRPAGSKSVRDVVEGWRAVQRSHLLRGLAAVQALAALSAGATSALLVVLAQNRLDAGPARFGVLLTAIAIGAAAGPLILQRFVRDVRRPGLLFGPYLLRGVVDIVLGVTRSFEVALGALCAYGIGTSTGNVAYNTLLQQTVGDRLRGRAFATFDVVWQTSRLASLAAGGALADAFGIATLYVAAGAVMLAAAAAGFRLVRPDAMRARIG